MQVYDYYKGERIQRGSRGSRVYFTGNSCRGREKIIEEADRKFMREGGNRKKKIGIIVSGS